MSKKQETGNLATDFERYRRYVGKKAIAVVRQRIQARDWRIVSQKKGKSEKSGTRKNSHIIHIERDY